MPKVKTTQRPYKQIIMERIGRQSQNQSYSNTHKKSLVQSLKTQCTPNDPDKTQQPQEYDEEYLFRTFQNNYIIKYTPVKIVHTKPINRSLYHELIQIAEKQKRSSLRKNKRKVDEQFQMNSKKTTRLIYSRHATQIAENAMIRNIYNQIACKKSQNRKTETREKKSQYKIGKSGVSSFKKLQCPYLSRQKSLVQLRQAQTRQKQFRVGNLRKSLSKADLKQKKIYSNYNDSYNKPMTNYLNLVGKKSQRYNQK